MIRAEAGFLWLLGAAIAAGQSPLHEAVSRADAFASQGQYEEAARAYDEAISLADPHNDRLMAELFYELARAKGNSGDFSGALIEIQLAESLNNLEAYAELHVALQRHEAASKEVTPSRQIRDALESIKGYRSFGVAGGRPKLNMWVGFDYDSAQLTARGRRQASEMADAMGAAEFHEDRFLLIGHTDTRGTEDYNLDLSLRRAQSLRDYLTARSGFGEGKIQVEGRGEQEPVAHGNSPSDHELNRRVEIQFIQ